MNSTLGVMRAICHAVQANRDRLNALDAALGDGDHGVSMAKTFAAVDGVLDSHESSGPAAIVDATGMTILTSVGGAMGPLFGSAFRAAATRLEGSRIGPPDVAASIAAARDAVAALGGAHPGDKTMLDALDPAARSAADAAVAGADVAGVLGAAARAAEQGAEATEAMRATVGRASRLGDRTLGHRDPGAASVALILLAAADAVATERT